MTASARLTGAAVSLLAVATFSAPASGQTAECQPAAGDGKSKVAGTFQAKVPATFQMVLAGRSGVFYDGSGPAFAAATRSDAQGITVDAVGVYQVRDAPAFGAVPAPAYRALTSEPRQASEVLLRLSITEAQYDRAVRILRTWERRAREKALLYPDIAMNNILLVKQVTETLKACGETLALYALDWGVEDTISERNRPSTVPFLYFKELRRLNERLHVRSESTARRH